VTLGSLRVARPEGGHLAAFTACRCAARTEKTLNGDVPFKVFL
jgi:hypothetical protein